ncbi:hypothetical protein BABINDRAFT_158842 [Babjeviella inositovora NRRL Y-12698]|uniref:CAF17 C-terminal domain-containing protein n=1 Tax=Babjeviella inositovora NRRL Y-12698 TaxID=984486 RepID=A0A1E3QWY7_9ASCO|nr:uncharacterized protein BABINDRAFT_158842 [Babjeviella inositovora NRRL Y-12698]ODQ82195.1 hypothetical protein BABINDRAFT_158842 [Babjeviella inositovora NRRL Y-12698]
MLLSITRSIATVRTVSLSALGARFNSAPASGVSRLSKSLIQVAGTDATKFLNGLITSRLMPTLTKKNEHTVTEPATGDDADIHAIDVSRNWGIMHEDIFSGAATDSERLSVLRDGIFSMILNSKGRVFGDVFLYPTPFTVSEAQSEDLAAYLLEVDTANARKMMMMLKMHKLKSQVIITSQPRLSSYYYYNDSPEFSQFVENFKTVLFSLTKSPGQALENATVFMQSEILFQSDAPVVGFAIDGRVPGFGVKFLVDDAGDADAVIAASRLLTIEESPHIVDEAVLRTRRFANGVIESADVLNTGDPALAGVNFLPFDLNLDYTMGMSLDKGCYVGQELTIRTYTAGVIRKRCVPGSIMITGEAPSSLIGCELSPIYDSPITVELDLVSSPFASPFGVSNPTKRRRRSGGKIVAVDGARCFALMSLDQIAKTKVYRCDLENGAEVRVEFEVPAWWPVE